MKGVRGKTLGLVAAALAVGGGALLLWRSFRAEPDGLIARLPPRQAVYAYVDVGKLRANPAFSGSLTSMIPEASSYLLLGEAVDAAAFSISTESVYAAASIELPEQTVRQALSRQGADCPSSLADASCAFRLKDGLSWLSARLIDENTLGLANSSDPEGADQLRGHFSFGAHSDLDPYALAAVADGALLWAAVDPPRLTEAMRNPPAGWANLSLFARALTGAETAYLRVVPAGPQALSLILEAPCGDEAAVAELESVLTSLNRFAAGAIRSFEGDQRWADVLATIQLTRTERNVRAEWLLDAHVLENSVSEEP